MNSFGSVIVSVLVLLSLGVTLFVVVPLIEPRAEQDDPKH